MTRDKQLNDLAAKLFREFSRTEYALKAAGYNNGNGPAEVNWRKVALAVEGLIATPTSPELQEAINFIFDAPPKKQVIADGKIQWAIVEPKTDSRADKLLQYVRRVRNNLLHGGKFNGHWFEPERSEPLLRHSLVILSACVEGIPEVRKAYHG
jgi:hypothetical protein